MGDSERHVCPVRGQSPVGNGGGEGFPKPLQGLDGVVEECRARFRHTDVACRGRKGQGACRNGICKTLVHTRLFVDAKIHFFGTRGRPLFVIDIVRPTVPEARNLSNPTEATKGVGLRPERVAACRRHVTIVRNSSQQLVS